MTAKMVNLLSGLLILFLPCMLVAGDKYSRNTDIDVLHYSFRLQLNDSTDQIRGSATITLSRMNRTGQVEFDLQNITMEGLGMNVTSVHTDAGQSEFRHSGNRIAMSLPAAKNESDTLHITIDYAGIPANGLIISRNKFGDRTFFGDNWPDRARHWLPCVDHPSDKASVEFIVTAPEHYQVVSNGLLAGIWPLETPSGASYRVTHWKETIPLPTKVMVIGVADFAWETAGYSSGIPVQSWVFQQNKDAGFADYRPAAGILTFYQNLIGPYAFGKLANVQSKTMFGGMENSGCIFYHERSVTGTNTLHSLLAHEIAHQWFGDAVTEKDWHHVWLSEGFATYLEAVYADSLLPDRKLDDNMSQMRRQVIRYHEKNHRPVIDTTITNLMDLLSTNSYQKGAWVLHMLRQELGDPVFWNGIRRFYDTYRNRNALTADFVSIMETVSGKSLQSFFHQWLEIPGHPELKWSWSHNPGTSEVTIDIEQVQKQHCFAFDLMIAIEPVTPATPGAGSVLPDYRRLRVDQPRTRITIPVTTSEVSIRLDPFTQLLFAESLQTRL